MKKKLALLIISLALVFMVSSCDLLNKFLPQEVSYRISFYNDGNLVEVKTVVKNSLIKAPNLEDKTGYEFIGWFKDLEDSSSKWDFENNKVNENLRLDALWEVKVNYLSIENIKIADENLVWDEIIDATYEVIIFDKTKIVSVNYFSLTDYKQELKEEKTLIIKPVKEGYIGLESEVNVKYNEKEIIEGYKIQFDEFDVSGFELNRSTYKTIIIDQDDYYLDIAEGKLTSANQEPKLDEVALILRTGGHLELKESYSNFAGLEFNLGNFNNIYTTSTLKLFVSNDSLDDWKLVGSYNNENTAGFTKFEVSDNEIEDLIDLNKEVFIRFEANIVDRNIVIDDIIIYQKVPQYFQVTIKGQIGKLDSYYKSAEGLKGKELFDELKIIISTNLNAVTYRDYKTIGEFADVKLDNKALVRGIYDLKDLKAPWGSKSEWHREHVWPNSRLGMDRVKETEVNQASDPHNLRAIYPSTNSSRSNRYYDITNNPTEKLGHTLSDGRYYPGEVDKGDVARILLYMVIRYEFLGLTDNVSFLSKKAYTIEAAYMGKLSILLNWHNQDPVDEFEINRNNVIFSYQNNRNPFIDHPELFEEIFNYLLIIDQSRNIKTTLYFEYEINYSELINNKNDFIVM